MDIKLNNFNKDDFLNNFLNFDKMITPTIIKTVYYLVLVLLGLAGIVILIDSFIKGLIFLILAPFVVRIQFELLIVIFKIHENLDAIKRLNQQQVNRDN